MTAELLPSVSASHSLARRFNPAISAISEDWIDIVVRAADGPFKAGTADTCPIHHGRIERSTGRAWLGEKVVLPQPTPEQVEKAGGVFKGEEDARIYGGLIGLTWVFERKAGGGVDQLVYPAVTDGKRAMMFKFHSKRSTGKDTNPNTDGDVEVRWDGNRGELLVVPGSELFHSPVFDTHPRSVRRLRFIGKVQEGVKREAVGTAFEDDALNKAGIKALHWQSRNGHLDYQVGLAERLEENLFRIASNSAINLDKFKQLLTDQGIDDSGVNGHGVLAATGKRVVYTTGGTTAPNSLGVMETLMLLSRDDCDSYILSAPQSEVVDSVYHNQEVPWLIMPVHWMN